jgi:hypothetical protein
MSIKFPILAVYVHYVDRLKCRIRRDPAAGTRNPSASELSGEELSSSEALATNPARLSIKHIFRWSRTIVALVLAVRNLPSLLVRVRGDRVGKRLSKDCTTPSACISKIRTLSRQRTKALGSADRKIADVRMSGDIR